jgi:transcriptional regulator with XRE-family HTH domain
MAAHYGETIRIERERRQLSQKRLALLAKVSRRHLASAELGANISIEILRRLANVLGIREIEVGEALRVILPASSMAVADLVPIADQIDKNARESVRLAGKLRDFCGHGVGKSAPNDTPVQGEVIAGAEELLQLVSEFGQEAQALTEKDRARVKRLERRVRDLIRATT